MRLGIEARWYTRGLESGRVMVTGLVDALVHSVLPPEDELLLFVDHRDVNDVIQRFAPYPHVRVKGLWFRNRLLAISCLLGPTADAAKVDVLLTHTFTPFRCHARKVLYIYDILFESHPHFFTPVERFYFRWVRSSCYRADAVIALSDFTKTQLSAFGYVEPDTVRVVYPGRPGPSKRCRVVRPQASPERYFLYVGRLNVRKNIPTLLAAYESILPHVGADLVLAGSPDSSFRNLHGRMTPTLRSRVHFMGYVAPDDLPSLYRGALAVIYVPTAEGFGLPVLEAMTYGVPVIASRGSGVSEALGDAGWVVNPQSEEELAAAMYGLATDPARSRDLALKATQRAAMFSWEATAQQVLDICRRTASEG